MARDTFTANGFTPAAHGCHWTRGEFAVSTIRTDAQHGYTVYRNRERIAEFVSEEQVLALCERRKGNAVVEVRRG